MTLNKQVSRTATRNVLQNAPQPPAFITEKPGFGQIVSDAFIQFNTVASAINAIPDPSDFRAAPDEDFDPFDGIDGTIFEDFPEALVNVNSANEKVQAEIDLREELDRRDRLANSGVLGFAATMAAGILDPLLFIPVGGKIKAVRTGIMAAKSIKKVSKVSQLGKIALTGKVAAESVSPLTSGVVTARAAFLGSSASEAVLQATQDTKTFGESAMNVTSATLLGGMLGTGVGLLSKRSRRLALAHIEDEIAGASGEAKGLAAVKLTEQDLVVPTGGGATGAEIKLQSALGAERLATLKGAKTVISPFVRVLVRSKSRAAKKAVLDLVDSPVRTEGVSVGSSVEAEILEADGLRYEMFTAADEAYVNYRVRIAKESGKGSAFVKAGGRGRRNIIQGVDRLSGRTKGTDILSKDEFMRLAGRASRTADSGIKEVDDIGRMWNERVYKPKLDDAIELGLLPEEVKSLGPIGARRYLQRSYLKNKLLENEPRFKSEKIKPWLLKVMDEEEVNGILKKAGLDELSAKVGGDDAIPPALRASASAESRAAIDDAVDLRVHDIFENLTSTTRGRVAYEQVKSGSGSPFKARALTWDDADIEEFLEDHIEALGERYIRTVVPDLALTRKFGSVDLTDQINEIGREYAKLRVAAKTPKARLKLQEQQAEDKSQLLGMAALLRGTYNVPTDNPLVTASRLAKSINFLSMGGGFGLNSIPDIGMIPLRNGLIRSFRTGYIPFIRHLGKAKLSRQELRRFGAAIDLVVDTRSRIISDVGGNVAVGRTQEAAQQVGQKFSIANLLSPWNSMMKEISGNVSMTRMIEAILKEGRGAASAKELANLDFARLTPAIRARIRTQLLRPNGMAKKGALKWSNTIEWDDLAAKQEWGRAVRFTVDNTIMTPGAGAAPLWLSSELGSLLFQFQRFSFGATNTLLLSSLQARDLATFNGLAMMTVLGMSVEWSKNQLNDRPNPTNLTDWTTAAIDRTGLMGVYGTIYNVGARATGKKALSSRFAARNLVSSLLGPTMGSAESASRLAINATRGEFSDADLRVFRRLLPFNQVPYLQGGFDQIEDGVARSLQLPKKRKRKSRRRR